MEIMDIQPITRRQFIKLAGVGLLVTEVLAFAPRIVRADELNQNTPPEEVPGGVDLKLSEVEKRAIEVMYKGVENKWEFQNPVEYINKFAMFLNITRARELKGVGFSNELTDFLNSKAEFVFSGIKTSLNINNNYVKRLIPSFTLMRDEALNGKISTSEYSIACQSLVQTLNCALLSNMYLFENIDPFHYYIGANNAVAYTSLISEIALPDTPTKKEEKVYATLNEFLYKSALDDDYKISYHIFDLLYSEPKPGLVQRQLNILDQISLGDVIFFDRSNGYNMGHPMFVLQATRNKAEVLQKVIGFDANLVGKMLAGTIEIDEKFLERQSGKLGILRTEFAHRNLLLNQEHCHTMLTTEELPIPLREGRPEQIPEFEKISEISSLWGNFSSKDNEWSDSILKIVNLNGLQIKDANREIVTGPVLNTGIDDLTWLCKIYQTRLAKSLGLKSGVIEHWDPFSGSEIDANETFLLINKLGRSEGLIDITHSTIKDRMKLLKQRHVLLGVTPGHTWMILPHEDVEGNTVAVLSQATDDLPWNEPSAVYKFQHPRNFIDVAPFRLNHPADGILFAKLLPNVEEPENPYRSPLFGYMMPDVHDPKVNIKTGWVTTINDLKTVVGDVQKLGYWEEVFETAKEKIPSENHYFRYVFDLVKTVQRYPLPIGYPAEKDPELFINYLKEKLNSMGYKKIVKSDFFKGAMTGIQKWFVTREMSMQLGREFQPWQCQNLAEVAMAASGLIDGSPPIVGGISGNAQEIAEHFLNLPRLVENQQESFVDRHTVAVHPDKDVPQNIDMFRAGDVFYIAYNSDSSMGHVGTVLTEPFLDNQGKKVVAIADANRYFTTDKDGNNVIITDGMPRIRIMDYEEFKKQFLVDKQLNINSRTVIFRKT